MRSVSSKTRDWRSVVRGLMYLGKSCLWKLPLHQACSKALRTKEETMLLVAISSWWVISGMTWARSVWCFQVHSDAEEFPLLFSSLSPWRRELHSIKGFFSPSFTRLFVISECRPALERVITTPCPGLERTQTLNCPCHHLNLTMKYSTEGLERQPVKKWGLNGHFGALGKSNLLNPLLQSHRGHLILLPASCPWNCASTSLSVRCVWVKEVRVREDCNKTWLILHGWSESY